MSARRPHIALAVGISIAILFLWLAVRETDFSTVRAALARADWRYAAAIIGVLAVYFWAKTVRWRLLLAPVAARTTRSLFPVVIVGYASNLVLPAQLGEVVRGYLAHSKLELPMSPTLVTIVIERMFDFLTILLFIGVLVALEPDQPAELVLAGYVSAGLGLAMLLGASLCLLWPRQADRLIALAVRPLPARLRDSLGRQLALAVEGLHALRDPRTLLLCALSSVAQWSLMGVCTYLGIAAVGVDVPFVAAFVVLVVTVLGMTLPNSPGFFGTIQLCFVIGLTPYGVEAGAAFAASVFFHLVLFVSVALAGAVYARRLNSSFASLYRSVGQETSGTGG